MAFVNSKNKRSWYGLEVKKSMNDSYCEITASIFQLPVVCGGTHANIPSLGSVKHLN